MGKLIETVIVINSMILKSYMDKILFIMVLLNASIAAIGSALFPVIFSSAIDNLVNKNTETGIEYILYFGICLTMVGILEQIQWLTFGPLNLKLQRNLTVYVFKVAMSMPYNKIKKYTTYEIGRTVERGLNSVRDITANLTFFLIPTLIELTMAAFIIAFVIDIWISLFLFASLILYTYITNISAEKIRYATQNAMVSGMDYWKFGLDGIANSELIQQSNKVDDFINYTDKKIKINNASWLISFKQRAYFGIIQSIIFGAIVVFVLWRGTMNFISGEITIGNLVLLNTYIIRLLQPIETFSRIYREVSASLGEAKLLIDFLKIPIDSAVEYKIKNKLTEINLKLENISLYINGDPIILNLSLELKDNETLFIVGPSGVGKSSLLRIISCLLLPDDGEYFINNEKVTISNMSYFRKNISVAQQNCLLFDWSIHENIVFGTHVDLDLIDNIINGMGLNETVSRHMELGNETVGEHGNRLSGGEKQRISLARALLYNCKLLILDEPTSALDEINKKRVLNAISEYNSKNKCATIVATHDVSLIKNSSKILFLYHNNYCWSGTHKDGIESNEIYKKFIEGLM